MLHAADTDGARQGIARHPRLRRWLLQRYVRPLLLPLGSPSSLPSSIPSSSSLPSGSPQPSGHKFHLRVHAVAVGAMSVWVHATPLLLLAAVPWREPPRKPSTGGEGGRGGGGGGSEGDGSASLLCHLTNHAQQVLGSSYCAEEHTRTLQEALGEAAAASIMLAVKRVVAQVFAAFARGSAAFFALPSCFELFGLDFALDPQARALPCRGPNSLRAPCRLARPSAAQAVAAGGQLRPRPVALRHAAATSGARYASRAAAGPRRRGYVWQQPSAPGGRATTQRRGGGRLQVCLCAAVRRARRRAGAVQAPHVARWPLCPHAARGERRARARRTGLGSAHGRLARRCMLQRRRASSSSRLTSRGYR